MPGIAKPGAIAAWCLAVWLARPQLVGSLAFCPLPLHWFRGGRPPVTSAVAPCRARGRDSLLTLVRLNRAKKNALSDGNHGNSSQVSLGQLSLGLQATCACRARLSFASPFVLIHASARAERKVAAF